jgi:hypothetical protein
MTTIITGKNDLACDSFFGTNGNMFLSILGVLLVSMAILVVVAIVAKLTLGD